MKAREGRSRVVAGLAVGLLGIMVTVPAVAAQREGAGVNRNGAVLPASRTAAGGFSAAALQPSDLPAGFSKPQTKVFTSYRAVMKVGKYTCTVYTPITRSTWRGGLVSESTQFSSSRSALVYQELDECAFALNQAAVAHNVYATVTTAVKHLIQTNKHLKGTKQVALPTIGDESMAFGTVVPKTNKYVTFDLTFRRGTTLVSLDYVGVGKALSAGTLSHIGMAIAARAVAGRSATEADMR